MKFDGSTFHYNSRCTDQAAVAKRIKEICETRVRYGYRRVHVLLAREGWGVNIKKVYRIYKELGMQLSNKTPKRRVKAKLRDDRTEAVGPNDVWAAIRPRPARMATSSASRWAIAASKARQSMRG